jgi:UMF1 family MFS transporter
VADSNADGQAIWGLTVTLAGLAIAILAPVLGAIADSRGPRKPWILIFSVPAVLGSWFLWYSTPDASHTAFILAAFALAFIGFEFAAVFNNAMMSELVPRARLGRLSGSAWALGYIGGIVSLVIVLGFMAGRPETGRTLLGFEPILGLDAATHAGDRASGPLTAIWYLVFVIPMFLFTPDVAHRGSARGAVRRGLRQLFTTLRELPHQKSYFSFLLSSLFYRDALNALYMFGGIYAAGVLGWSTIELGIFGILAALTGVFGAWFGGQVDDRLGPKTVVTAGIAMLVVSCILVVSTSKTEALFLTVGTRDSPSNLPTIVFYLAGCIIGAAGGAAQAASRTLLVDQVPREKVTEAFGLYALSGKATAFIGPLLISIATFATDSQRLGVTPIILLFVIGLALLPLVRSAHSELQPA